MPFGKRCLLHHAVVELRWERNSGIFFLMGGDFNWGELWFPEDHVELWQDYDRAPDKKQISKKVTEHCWIELFRASFRFFWNGHPGKSDPPKNRGRHSTCLVTFCWVLGEFSRRTQTWFSFFPWFWPPKLTAKRTDQIRVFPPKTRWLGLGGWQKSNLAML